MEVVLLVYGAAFVATGCALGVQARAASSESLPTAALWAITAFALIHGAGDWTPLVLGLEERGHGALPGNVALARLALLALSFAILGAFGLLLAQRSGSRARRLAVALAIPAMVAAAWGAGVAVELERRPDPLGPGGLAAAEGSVRYLLGVPACAVALAGLRRARRALAAEAPGAADPIGAASVALAAYGFFTGLVVPASDLGLARTLNEHRFLATTHVPVELLRAGAIAAAGLLLSEVFVRSTAARHRREADHVREEHASLVAHDLRTPLGRIDMGASLLERLEPEQHGSERERRILGAIRGSVRAMSRMLDDLLEASRLASRRLPVSPERLDLGPLLAHLAEWEPAGAARGRSVRLVVPRVLPAVIGDPVRVEQVLENLLSNAGKYSPPGSEIVLEARAGPRDVTLSVRNAGEGIPPRDLPHVFARSFRTRAARTGGAPGLGLGLFIAKELVESQNGRIWVRSEAGGQTTFAFTLPRVHARRRLRLPWPRRRIA